MIGYEVSGLHFGFTRRLEVYWLFFLSALNTCKDFIECTPQEL